MQSGYRFDLFQADEPRVGIIIGTGPSLTAGQLAQVRHLRKFGANRAYEFGCDVVHGCNYQFWDYYWPAVAETGAAMWTSRPELNGKYPGLNYIQERWEQGLSTDPSYICAHHGTGPQLVNLAYHYGCEVMLLIGWDMKYPPRADRYNYIGKRHYFGEYPESMQHWPIGIGAGGELDGLIAEMATIHPEDYGIEIWNCTPGSAMRCFPFRSLSESLSDLGLSRE